MEKFCQSCAMPLTIQNLGTNGDGTQSSSYCQYCYLDGQFTQPDVTFNQMKAIGLKGLDDTTSLNGIKRFFLKLSYPSLLKRMTRWQ